MKEKYTQKLLFIIGYLLSPLSWWNDIFINLPIAYILAFPFGLISEKLFLPVMVFGYWMTNLLGFVFMHYSLKRIIQNSKSDRNSLIKSLLISIFYTIIVIVLAKIGILKFPRHYFK